MCRKVQIIEALLLQIENKIHFLKTLKENNGKYLAGESYSFIFYKRKVDISMTATNLNAF